MALSLEQLYWLPCSFSLILHVGDPATLASLGEKYQYLKFQSVWISKLINYPADNVLFILSNLTEYSLPPAQYVIMKI